MPNPEPIEDVIQMNSLWSWSQLVPLENIIVFFDDEKSCAHVKNRYDSIVCVSFSRSKCFQEESKRPYISCAYEIAQERSRTPILLFVNGDILLHSSVSSTIEFVNARLPEFFLVGCRRDYELTRSSNYSDPEKVLQDGLIHSRMHSTTGIDVIVFKAKKPLYMPPFLVGVYRWDNWLLSEVLLRTNISVIDVTQSIYIIHQQPEKREGETIVPHSGRSGAGYNDALAKNISGVDYKVGFINNAHSILTGDCQNKQCDFKDNLAKSEIVLLKKRANPLGYIAVLTVTSGYMPLAWNWICWAKRIGFKNYLLLAEDYESYKVLMAANEPVYISQNQSMKASSKEEAVYGSIDFQITMMYRLEFLMSVLRAGFHFLSADMDTIWFADPFDYISHNLSITIQGQTHKQTKMSGGFIILHATSKGRAFWQAVIKCQQINLELLRNQEHIKRKRPASDFTEQECINDRLNTTKINLLNPYLFTDGRAFFDLHQPQSRGIVPVVIHGNWLVGMENKIKRLRAWNLLSSTGSSCESLENGIPYSESNKKSRVAIRIRILTYNRLQSLQRLLESLQVANYSGDTVSLDISIDRPSSEASTTEKTQWEEVLAYVGDGEKQPSKFKWLHGPYSVLVHKTHVGLTGQWTISTDHQDMQVFLEDDVVVSPHYYIFLKRAIDFYYLNESNYDSRLYGFSLQHQHTVLGQRSGFRPKTVDKELNDTGSPMFYKYQLLGTWGILFFPEHWRAFLAWIKNVNLDDMQAGCTPNLLSTQWWVERFGTGRMWTPWFIRFAFERGWYSLYNNYPNKEAFVVSYRESGLNFNVTRGPMNPVVEHIQPNLHFNFTPNPPIFDYHFTHINQSGLLAIRNNLWNRNFVANQCIVVEKNVRTTTISLKKTTRSSSKTKTTKKARRAATEVLVQDSTELQPRSLQDMPLLPSSDCFKWFLFFEVIFVFPIVVVVVVWACVFNNRKRNTRRKPNRK